MSSAGGKGHRGLALVTLKCRVKSRAWAEPADIKEFARCGQYSKCFKDMVLVPVRERGLTGSVGGVMTPRRAKPEV